MLQGVEYKASETSRKRKEFHEEDEGSMVISESLSEKKPLTADQPTVYNTQSSSFATHCIPYYYKSDFHEVDTEPQAKQASKKQGEGYVHQSYMSSFKPVPTLVVAEKNCPDAGSCLDDPYETCFVHPCESLNRRYGV